MSLQELETKLACQDVVVSFAAALDNADNEAGAALLADDAVIHVHGKEISGEGAAKKAVLGRSAEVAMRHVLSNIIVTSISETTAQFTAYACIYRVPRVEGDSFPLTLPKSPSALGEWSFDLAKEGDVWKIKSFKSVPKFVVQDS